MPECRTLNKKGEQHRRNETFPRRALEYLYRFVAGDGRGSLRGEPAAWSGVHFDHHLRMRNKPTSFLQAIGNFIKAVWFLPRNLSLAIDQKRRQDGLDLLEAERLDRIRNPSKYLGK
jgi:hypothetical protein